MKYSILADGASLSDTLGDREVMGHVPHTSEKLLLQPAEVAGVDAGVRDHRILVASGHWMWPKEEAKGRMWGVTG